MTKLGGIIGFFLGAALTLYVGDHIDFLSRQSDYLGTAAALAVGIVGWAVGSSIVRRLTARHHARPRSLP